MEPCGTPQVISLISYWNPLVHIWNRLPYLAVSHVIPSVDNFHKFAKPAIRVMLPLYGAALI